MKRVVTSAATAACFTGALLAGLMGAGCAPGGYYNTSQGSLDSLLTTQAEMMRRISILERKVDATREGVQASRANNETRLLEISQRLDVLEAKLEESGVRFTQLAQKVDTVKYKLTAADSARAAAGFVVRDSTGVPDAEAMYQAAYSDVAAGRYNLARESFQSYLKNFPDSEVSDNAQYWIGECYYVQGDFAGAIAEFEKVIDRYPKGDKVPAALFKIGLSYNRLKNEEQFQKYLRTLIQKYPKSPEAALAKERLSAKG